MTSPRLLDLGQDILLVEKLLDATLCQHIIQVAECIQFDPSKILMGVVDREVRSGGLLPLDGDDPLQKSTQDLLYEKIKIIQGLIYGRYGIDFPNVERFSILRYQAGEGYRRHVDNLLLASRMMEVAEGIPTRDISIVGYLNQDFSGGETFFDRQDVKVIPQTGSVLVFPSSFTHPHQALPVQSGVKYAFTTWLYY
ncbi:2OG-Fe(II) oxygenase [Thermosynechococcaceae cyanobacterium BACA0444]|uniref:2OG-Fe(II) oxygenase n=1 Tax=Pseudocalidococcus azoricus BACA0444 TaxID=2918990 RepID=A0AAE4FUD4_9CYAN|nr:2OG-Fe(II) oxygenase [Pseudocalidococcus azoricus]MDS3861141.1 2OG-Fe(II) oxygenase [Pseudocalidococcus azoricus BACA0444]